MKAIKRLTLLLVLIVGGSYAFYYFRLTPRSIAAQEIRVIRPNVGNLQSFISTTGTVQPQNRLEIKPPIAGRIEQILVQEGDKVKAGQILAYMSSTERAALLDAARGKDEETQRYWQEVYKPTPLVAPIDGEVIVKAVEPGQTISVSEPLLVLSDRLIVQAQVDETDIGKVKMAQPTLLSLDAYPQIEVRGKVDHISYESKILNNVTIYLVDILPEKIPEVFRSGMSANVRILEESKENILILSQEVVKRDDRGSYVLVNQGKGKPPQKRQVQLGMSDESNVEIVSGVDENDEILMDASHYQPPKEGKGGNSSPFSPFGRRNR